MPDSNPVPRKGRQSEEDKQTERVSEVLGVRPPLNLSKVLALEVTSDPEAIEDQLNEKKARLAQLNDDLETAREEVKAARESYVEKEMAQAEGQDVDLDAARTRLDDAEQAKREAETLFANRAEALRNSISALKQRQHKAKAKQQAEEAKDLNEQAVAKAQELKQKLEELKALNTEIADLQEKAQKISVDGGMSLYQFLKAEGLDTPLLHLKALDNQEERYHKMGRLNDLADFFDNFDQDSTQKYVQ